MKQFNFYLVQFEDLTGMRNGVADHNATFLAQEDAMTYANAKMQKVDDCNARIFKVSTNCIDDKYCEDVTEDESTLIYLGMDTYASMEEVAF